MANHLIPKSITILLDIAAENIARTINIELWDDATSYLMKQLQNNAKSKFGLEIAGCKYLADVKEHIESLESDSRYFVSKRMN